MKQPKVSVDPVVLTSIDGTIVPPDQALISVYDNTFLYAQGLFETFLGVNNRVLFEKQHFDRLWRGAREIDLSIPCSRAQLSRWMRALLARHPANMKKLRLTVTAGDSARWLGKPGRPRIVMSVGKTELPTKPFDLIVSQMRVDHRSKLRRIKTVSYALQATALQEALTAGADDALMLNELGKIAEITSANIFWVKNAVVFTPGLQDGCLDGVTRRNVISACKRMGIQIVEKSVPVEVLTTADEVFLSSSLKLVTPICRITMGRKRMNFPTGPITARLADHFRRAIARLQP